ncbi:AraC family transcriptional regulator [Thalassotalea sp. M1531]|uniref:AraC family transcriptional regulator n=1 Tax=Thalassotalea algicola TaxID=2716224 RepID=A0A7Y0LBK6_9GAMM|nr:AraC family transcriptional regulator [Thalassotalea algicola]NMP31297.1 AraC family transcriptional regulator [Thalassotalea algicola]
MDKLSAVIQQFTIQAGVFYTGQVCGFSPFEDENSIEGHIHILRSGQLTISQPNESNIVLNEPSIVFFPQPKSHRLQATESDNAQLVCAAVKYGIGKQNPITQALPNIVVLPISKAPGLKESLSWLLTEAQGESLGKQVVLDRLMEVFIIYLLRHLMTQGKVEQGLLAGLAHPQLSQVLIKIHENPEHSWSLEEMAELALMSRSKFSPLFKEVVGQTPNDYLTSWRVNVAKSLLLEGKAVSLVANLVGYDSGSTLSRAFQKLVGVSPKLWLEQTLA